MIDLIPIKPHDDTWQMFHVSFDKDMTIREFIDEVLTKNTWGFIYVNDINNPSADCEYRQNVLISELPSDMLDYEIEKVTASGGWTRMDYTIHLKQKK